MAILTKGSIVKGSANAVQLSKADLLAHAKVAADSYFNQQTNWYKVMLMYKSDVGEQNVLVSFDATVPTPASSFFVSNKARNQFNIEKLVLIDFDNGELIIPRSGLVTAEFDITIA